MSRILRLAAVTLLLSALSATGATISGTVSKADSGTVLSSMIVAAYDSGGSLQGSATSDSAGQYVQTLPAGDYRLLAYDPAGTFATHK